MNIKNESLEILKSIHGDLNENEIFMYLEDFCNDNNNLQSVISGYISMRKILDINRNKIEATKDQIINDVKNANHYKENGYNSFREMLCKHAKASDSDELIRYDNILNSFSDEELDKIWEER